MERAPEEAPEEAPVGDEGQPPPEVPAPPVPFEFSLFDKHDAELLSNGKSYKEDFLCFLRDLINLTNCGKGFKYRHLAKSYCSVYEGGYQTLVGCLDDIKASIEHKRHLKALSGLGLKHGDEVFIIVHYFEDDSAKGVYMIRHGKPFNCSNDKLKSKAGFIKVNSAQLRAKAYELVCFNSKTLTARILGDLPETQKRYVPKRHKPPPDEHKKKQTRKRDASASDDEYAPVDKDACEADLATLGNGPARGQGQHAQRQDRAQGGARAAGAPGSAGGSSGVQAAGGVRIDEEDGKHWITSLFDYFNPELVAEHVSKEMVFPLIEALKKKHQDMCDKELAKLHPSDHRQALALLRHEARMQAKMGPGAPLAPARKPGVLVLSKDLGVHYPIKHGLQKFFEDMYDLHPQEEEHDIGAGPQGPGSVNPKGSMRHKRPRLEKDVKEYSVPADAPYLHLCYVPPSNPGISHDIIALTLSPNMTKNWCEPVPGEEVLFVILLCASAYEALPDYVRDLIYMIDGKPQFTLLKDVKEVDALLPTDWMDRFYSAPLPEMHTMVEEQIGERLLWEGKPIKQVLEELYLPVIQERVESANRQAEAAWEKRKRDLQRRDEFVREPTTKSGQPKKKPRISEAERMNGYEAPQRREVPTKVTVKLRAYCITPMCAGNLGNEHGSMCPLDKFKNPITHPIYTKYAKSGSRADARLMNCTMPRFFLDGLLSCRCLCDVHARMLPARE